MTCWGSAPSFSSWRTVGGTSRRAYGLLRFIHAAMRKKSTSKAEPYSTHTYLLFLRDLIRSRHFEPIYFTVPKKAMKRGHNREVKVGGKIHNQKMTKSTQKRSRSPRQENRHRTSAKISENTFDSHFQNGRRISVRLDALDTPLGFRVRTDTKRVCERSNRVSSRALQADELR